MSETFPVPLSEVQGGGVHKLKVVAIDQVGNEREEQIEFEYFPATGIKDEYVMQHFPLPDGEGNEAEEEDPKRPELAVNVANGNLVFRQRDVEVAGPAVDLEVERFYNSELPKSNSTEWGTGWTVGQTPKLEPEEGGEAPKKAALVGTSGAVTHAVTLPTESGGEKFDAKLGAMVTKEAGGGYAITDKSGETDTTMAFTQANKMTELRTPGSATVKYSYEAGNLSMIAVNDPGSAGSSIRSAAEAEAEGHLATPSYRSSFGAAGSGNGQLKHPADVAVDSHGNLWVADKENNRVEEFNEAGEFLRAAGSLGAGAGQLNSPSAVAMDSFGNVDVTDTANNRVVRFNEKGEFVSAIGANVNKTKVEAGGTLAEKNHCTASSGNVCQAGTAGSAEGLMAEPIGITTSGGGNFLVVEKANGRVEKFNTNGELLAKFGTSTNEGHQLKEPTAIANAPNGGGYFWVADTGNNRIEEWTSSFAFVRAVGKEGSGNSEFRHPDAIEADAEGNIYIADKGNGRVQELNSAGEYLGKFGSSGSGATQFSLSDPAGVTLDNKGNIWLTDPGNNRVERWLAPYNPVYASQLGATGNGNGQFKHPADAAVDSKGNLWVVDKENNRVEEFNEAGEFLRAAGTFGSGAGQLNSPSAIAIDSVGNLDVTDTGNNRVAQFSSTGAFIEVIGSNVNKTKVESGGTTLEKNRCTAASGNVCQAGTSGSGEGQMAEPIGITTTGGQNMFVVERANNRVEKFSPQAETLAKFGELGSGNGQLKEPTAIGFHGFLLWVADTGNERMEAFTTSYVYSRKFGGEGSANGPLGKPIGVETDESGNVWVAEQSNNRVQEFSEAGISLSKFGFSGSGTGQFSLSSPVGLVAESKGNIWVTDAGNNRLEKWVARSTAPSSATVPVEPDPAVAVKTSSGLVTGVEGEASGATTYSHQGQALTAVNGPRGKTEYTYDSQERLTKVTLPKGTWGEVKYDAYGRVESVKVSVEGGKAKTTTFQYKVQSESQPRRTTVSPEEEPATIYDIAPDGSVFKWWDVALPPEIENLSGTLYEEKETSLPIGSGDYQLLVQAFSNQGIASIQIVANGDQLVDEKTCTITESTSCKTVEDPWVTNTGNWAPGILQLEVIVTDHKGNTESSRFWVNIPYTTPPEPEAPEPPTFEDIARFREEFGLDLDLKGNEIAIDERIFNLIGSWYNPQTPLGQVARSSWERWGVPLRPADVAELEYRERYVEADVPEIETWATEHASTTYAGVEIDQAGGGIIRVGFTESGSQRLVELKESLSLLAPERVDLLEPAPGRALTPAELLEEEVSNLASQDPQLSGTVTGVQISESSNLVLVETSDVAATEQRLNELLGSLAGVSVVYEPSYDELLSSRFREGGRMLAGEAVFNDWTPSASQPDFTWGTAGFGAFEKSFLSNEKRWLTTRYLLTAGHMGQVGTFMYRIANPTKSELMTRENKEKIGRVGRDPYSEGSKSVDALAVRFTSDGLAPTHIFGNADHRPEIGPASAAFRGENLCFSGARSGHVKCLKAIRLVHAYADREHNNIGVILCKALSVKASSEGGDSGSPVWDPRTGKSVGLIEGRNEQHPTRVFVQPLVTTTWRHHRIVGALDASVMGGGSLHVIQTE